MILPMDTVPLPMVRARPVPCAAEAGRGRWVAAEWNGQPATKLLAGRGGVGGAGGQGGKWVATKPRKPPPPARASLRQPVPASDLGSTMPSKTKIALALSVVWQWP